MGKLLDLGARIPPSAVGGAAEMLNSVEMAALLELGAKVCDAEGDWRPPVALVLETYTRNPRAKHEILEMFVQHGIQLPGTPPMRYTADGSISSKRISREIRICSRGPFSHQEIWPPELGCHSDEALALCGAPLGGTTLLHICADYEELYIARWLLDRGMNVNARAAVD